MSYHHEYDERKQPDRPMNTTLPVCVTDPIQEQRMENYLWNRDLDVELAIENGWFMSVTAGDTYPRIVIPAVTHKPGHVYWQARDTTGSAFIRYQCPKGPRHEALIRITPEDTVYCPGIVVVEGPMDALAAAGAGYLGYALMGMHPNQATLMHLALLIEDNADLPVLVLLDKGETFNAIAVSTFLCCQGYQSRVAELPEKDLAQCHPHLRAKFLSQKFTSLFK